MLDENMTIKTPSVEPEVLEYIKEQAELWKGSDRSGKSFITKEFKKIYDIDTIEYEYFKALKETKPEKQKKEKKISNYKTRTQESKERKIFSDCLSEYLKKYLYTRNGYDSTEGLFVVDENFNLPSYFWIRLNTNVLPKWEENGIVERHAWILAKRVCEIHEDELISRLQNTDFHDLKHLANSIIQFLNKYMLTTYVEIKKQAQQKLINEARAEQRNQIQETEQLEEQQSIVKRPKLKKKRKIIKF